jgi:hypothetical protein
MKWTPNVSLDSNGLNPIGKPKSAINNYTLNIIILNLVKLQVTETYLVGDGEPPPHQPTHLFPSETFILSPSLSLSFPLSSFPFPIHPETILFLPFSRLLPPPPTPDLKFIRKRGMRRAGGGGRTRRTRKGHITKK